MTIATSQFLMLVACTFGCISTSLVWSVGIGIGGRGLCFATAFSTRHYRLPRRRRTTTTSSGCSAVAGPLSDDPAQLEQSNPFLQQQQRRRQDPTFNSHAAVVTVESNCNNEIIQTAAGFLVDAYWLGSCRQWIHIPPPPAKQSADEPSSVPAVATVSDSVRKTLIARQAQDLTIKYGERLGGKRLLPSCLIMAHEPLDGNNNDDENSIVPKIKGMLGLQVVLLNTTEGNILTAVQSEEMLTMAVASLKPQQRRRYREASARQIASDLLPSSDVTPVCCVSNLAVSPTCRNQGIATQLCRAAEVVAAQDWQYPDLYLKVERDNAAAVQLYLNNQYTLRSTIEADPALRLDLTAGDFVDTVTGALLFSKKLP